MKLTPRSTAWRRRLIAALESAGGPQTPRPVIRIAPKPILRIGTEFARSTASPSAAFGFITPWLLVLLSMCVVYRTTYQPVKYLPPRVFAARPSCGLHSIRQWWLFQCNKSTMTSKSFPLGRITKGLAFCGPAMRCWPKNLSRCALQQRPRGADCLTKPDFIFCNHRN